MTILVHGQIKSLKIPEAKATTCKLLLQVPLDEFGPLRHYDLCKQLTKEVESIHVKLTSPVPIDFDATLVDVHTTKGAESPWVMVTVETGIGALGKEGLWYYSNIAGKETKISIEFVTGTPQNNLPFDTVDEQAKKKALEQGKSLLDSFDSLMEGDDDSDPEQK
jgi:hypothetical protein